MSKPHHDSHPGRFIYVEHEDGAVDLAPDITTEELQAVSRILCDLAWNGVSEAELIVEEKAARDREASRAKHRRKKESVESETDQPFTLS